MRALALGWVMPKRMRSRPETPIRRQRVWASASALVSARDLEKETVSPLLSTWLSRISRTSAIPKAPAWARAG